MSASRYIDVYDFTQRPCLKSTSKLNNLVVKDVLPLALEYTKLVRICAHAIDKA